EVYRLPYPYYYRSDDRLSSDEVDEIILERLKDFFISEASPEDIGAVIIEPAQGEGGFVVPSKRFMQGLKKISEDNRIVVVADEMQTGFGRAEILAAMEQFGVEPDLVTMSKSVAGGMPPGAVTGRAEIVDAPEVGQIGGTFAGSPVACAA